MSEDNKKTKEKLKKRILHLLQEVPEHSATCSVFFGLYKKKYKNLPEPRSFNVPKRTDILRLFKDVCEVCKPSGAGEAIVKLSREYAQNGSIKNGDNQVSVDAVRILSEQLTELLGKEPGGYKRRELWKLFATKFGSRPNVTDFGGCAFNDILDHISAVEEHTDDTGSKRIRLKCVRSKERKICRTVDGGEAAGSQVSRGEAAGAQTERSKVKQSSKASNIAPSCVDSSQDMKRSRGDAGAGFIPHPGQQQAVFNNQDPYYGMNYPQLSHDTQWQRPPQHVPFPCAPPQRAPPQPQGPYQQVNHSYMQQRHDRSRYDSGGHGPPSKKIFIPKDQLDNVAKDCIERLSESKKYVSLELIQKLVLQHYDVSHLAQINVQDLKHIPCVNDHMRVQAKVNAYIEAFMKTRAIATLHELGEALKTFVAEGKDFESLHLGALVQQPMVYHFFKFPTDGTDGPDVPELTTSDILEYLRSFLTEKDLWTKKSELVDFMNYLVEKRDLDNPYELGIRITSLALGIQVLKRAQKDTGQAIRGAISQLREMAECDLTKAFDNFVRSVVSKEPGFCVVRQEYGRMPARQLMDVLFKKLDILYASVNFLQELHQVGKGQIREVHNTQTVLHNMLNRMRQDQVLQRLFQFAICCSQEEIHIQLNEILGLAPGTTQAPSSGQTVEDGNKPKPTMYDMIVLIKEYVERCLLHGNLDMSNLARVENKILEKYDFPHFHALGHGSFMDIMAKNPEIKKFLEDSGGSAFGLSASASDGGTSYQPSIQDLLYFVHQCGVRDETQVHMLEDALCSHYCSADVKSLGHGSVKNLLRNLEKNPSKGQNSYIQYEGALVAKSSNPCLARGRKVGVLGHQAKDRALACLQNCPLLQDLQEWSQWDIVFEPELGDIRDFVQKYGSLHTLNFKDQGVPVQMTTSILALETKPGTLLRITAETSPDKLATAALEGDVEGTCGHLVSLIVANHGLENTGLVLLGNHIKTAIIKMQASQIPGGPTDGAGISAKFVLNCLTLLPRLLCVSVAQQVFLEPLGQVIGLTKSRDLLLNMATDSVSGGRLQLLGLMLGLEEWSRCFLQRTETPRDCTQKLDTMAIDDVIMIDDDESSDTDSEDEDEDDILSDEEQAFTPPKEFLRILSQSEDQSDSDVVHTISDSNTEQEVGESEPELIRDDTSSISNEIAEVPKSPPGEQSNPYRMIIEQIRREEFGVDVILSEDGQKLMQKQQERLGRSLVRLSKDLYSKNTHFVLELIQNADDNDYPEGMSSGDNSNCPSVKFVVDENVISVLNNECGFLEKNIRALCDVGRSTKGQHTYGYIGQKGIGFKSVFRVTDRPEIHSNGYHMCFDVNSGPTGYILPHWIEENTKENTQWTTRIVLPLKQGDVSQKQTMSLAARFQDVHPSLLLFLHRLKAVTVVNKVEDYTLRMRRQDLGDHIIEIKHTKATDRWFVVRKTLDASKISLQAKSGVDVGSTEIAMAFPLQSQENVQAQIQPQKQPVFAFLPLRSYGFRFVIQGDFDVPSSREDVDRDSLWNQWLRSELHLLFMDTLQKFREHPEFSDLTAVCRFLQFVPLEDEILDFFRPVATQILQQLRARPCLPAASANKRLTWKLPSQLVLSKDRLLSDVIPSSVLREHLSLDYLHPDVAAILNPTLMSSLGVQKMSLNHLIEIRKAMLNKQSKQCLDEEILRTAKWLACVYRALDEFDSNGDILEQIRKLPTIPLVDGSLVSLDEKSVFFPPDNKQRSRSRQDLLLALYQDLNSVHPQLLQGLESVANSQVANLLERLGVKRLTPHDIMHHHILPVLKTNQWQNKSRELLIAYTVFIKEQLDHNSSMLNMDEFKDIAVVLTNHGPKKPSETSVHFTPAYLNRVDLQTCLPGYDWVLLDACYTAGAQAQQVIKSWRDFFAKIGVVEFLAVKSENVSLTPQELAASPWGIYKEFIPAKDGYKLMDKRCAELEALICDNKQPDSHLNQLKNLFEILDQLWDGSYKEHYTRTQLCDDGGHALKDVETSFSFVLKNMPWVPARVTETGSNDVMVSELKRMIPSMLFVQNEKIERLLSNHVPYLYAKDSPNSTFATFLGIRFEVSRDYVKDLLISWCDRKDPANKDIRKFTTTLVHMKTVYRFLHDNLTPKDLQDLTHQYPVIFVIDGPLGDPQSPVSGSFLARHEVRWSDPSGLFSKHKASLDSLDHEGIIKKPELLPLYGDMKDLFLKSMRIEKKPCLEDYLRLMLHISATTTGTQEWNDILKILTVIGQSVLDTGDGDCDLQIRNLKLLMDDQKCLLEKHRHVWVSLKDSPMIADNTQFEKMFKDRPAVKFLDCGEKLGGNKQKKQKTDQVAISSDAIRRLYEALGVEYLSQCVEVTSVTELYAPCHSLQKYIHDVIGYVQRLLAAEYEDVYSKLEAKGIGAKLAAMTFGQVRKLEMVYSLKNFPEDTPLIQNEKSQINIEDGQFIVHADHVHSYGDINRELARYFSQGDQHCFRQLKEVLDDLCLRLQECNPDLQNFVDQHNIETLPEGEIAWNVKEPTITYQQPSPLYRQESHVSDEGSCQSLPPTPDPDTASTGPKVWPPNSSGASYKPRGHHNPSQTSTMWPPPKPPVDMDRSQLPPNLRPSKYTSEARRPDDAERSQTQVERQASSGGRRLSSDDVQRSKIEGDHVAADDVLMDDQPTVEPALENVEMIDVLVTKETDEEAQNVDDMIEASASNSRHQQLRKRPRVDSDSRQDGQSSNEQTRRPIFFAPPEWTEDADDVMYQEIGQGHDLSLPDEVRLDERADQHEIGDWGEALVKNYLVQLAAEQGSGIMEITWINEDDEMGKPYDFIIKVADPEDPENVQEIYIEVKSTLSSKKAFFEISSQQFKFAQKAQEKFHIYRVFNAGKNQVRLTKLENLAAKMDTKQIKLCMVV